MGEARAAGAWVKSQRLASGMTQEELAGKSGLSVRAISNLERGRTARPHPRSLEVLAAALGLPEAAGTAWAARLRADQARDASPQAPRPLPTAGERSSQPSALLAASSPGSPDGDLASPEAAAAPGPLERPEPAERPAHQGADPAPRPRAATALAPLAQGDPSRIGSLRARAGRRRATRRVQIGLAPLLILAFLALVVAARTAMTSHGAGLRTLSPSSPAGSSAGYAPAQWAPPAVMLGTWIPAEGDGTSYSTIAGQHPNVANTYLLWGDSFPTSFASQAQSAGAIPFVEIEPWQGVRDDGNHGNACNYAHFPAMNTIGANGAVISRYLGAFGSAIASFGHPVIITFAHGFNVSGQYPWAWGDCEGTTAAQWIKAWDTVRSDIDATAGGLAHFMWAPGPDTGGTTIDPTPYWPGASQVDMVGVGGILNKAYGPQLGTFSGVFGPVFNEIHTLTSLPIFIAETNLVRLDGRGYQSLPGFISDLCSNGGDGVLQFQDDPLDALSSKQWSELDKALASDCGASPAKGG
jgi:transcriptional regulator with XRE-family HTH domain